MSKNKTAITPRVEAEAEAEKPFALDTNARLVRADGSYFEVVANAEIKGVASVVLQMHNADGTRAPHPQAASINAGHGAVPLDKIKAAIDSGEYKLGHAPA